MRILITGGTGTISLHAARHLLAAGHAVTLLNRSGGGLDGAEVLRADRHDAAQLTAALAGRRFDATVDMLCFDPVQAAVLAAALPEPGHLVFCSTVCALGFDWPTWPVPEDAPCRPDSPYGRGKAAAESWWRQWAAARGVPLTILRPSTTFDDRIGVLRQVRWDGSAWLARLRAGQPIVLADGGLALHQFMHADDAGRAFALVAAGVPAPCRTYHLIGAATTWREHARLAAHALGVEGTIVSVPADVLDRETIPGDGIRRDIFGRHGCFAADGLARDHGFVPRIPLEQAIQRTIASLDAAGRLIPDADQTWEDALVRTWGRTAG